MPNGVNVESGLKSWSNALVNTLDFPPLEKLPIFTAAFASKEILNSSVDLSAFGLTSFRREKIASVCGIFFLAYSLVLY